MTQKLLLTLAATSILSAPLKAQEHTDVQDIREARKARRAMPVAKSITSINLLHVTEENVGIAISYERFLKGSGNVSLYLPLSFALPQNDWGDDGPTTYQYGGYYGYYVPPATQTTTRGIGMAYVCAGIKVYPGGAHTKVSYALGTSLVFGVGNVQETTRNYKLDTLYNGTEKIYERT